MPNPDRDDFTPCGLHGCEEGCILCDPNTTLAEIQAWGYGLLATVERLEGERRVREATRAA